MLCLDWDLPSWSKGLDPRYLQFFVLLIIQDPKMKSFTDALKNIIKSTLQSSLYAMDLQTDEPYGHLWILGNSRWIVFTKIFYNNFLIFFFKLLIFVNSLDVNAKWFHPWWQKVGFLFLILDLRPAMFQKMTLMISMTNFKWT